MVTPQPLIGITGRKRAGKDTLARIFVERYGFHRLGFADRLKLILARIDPMIKVDLDGDPWSLSDILYVSEWEWLKDEEPEVRRLLQQLGTGVRDILGPDSWVNPVIGEAHWRLAEGQQVVIPDVRFPNEADRIKDLGGVIVRVHRDPIGSDLNSVHISETAMDDYQADFDIDNTGSIDSLRLAAADILDRIL